MSARRVNTLESPLLVHEYEVEGDGSLTADPEDVALSSILTQAMQVQVGGSMSVLLETDVRLTWATPFKPGKMPPPHAPVLVNALIPSQHDSGAAGGTPSREEILKLLADQWWCVSVQYQAHQGPGTRRTKNVHSLHLHVEGAFAEVLADAILANWPVSLPTSGRVSVYQPVTKLRTLHVSVAVPRSEEFWSSSSLPGAGKTQKRIDFFLCICDSLRTLEAAEQSIRSGIRGGPEVYNTGTCCGLPLSLCSCCSLTPPGLQAQMDFMQYYPRGSADVLGVVDVLGDVEREREREIVAAMMERLWEEVGVPY